MPDISNGLVPVSTLAYLPLRSVVVANLRKAHRSGLPSREYKFRVVKNWNLAERDSRRRGQLMRRWVHPEKARYYQADLVEDLLGGWSVVTAWGGLGSRRGQVRRTWVASHEDGVRRLQEIEKRRQQRGYRPASDGAGQAHP